MAIDIIQKTCPKCGSKKIRIERTRFAKRHCTECGETWIPVKNPEREKDEE